MRGIEPNATFGPTQKLMRCHPVEAGLYVPVVDGLAADMPKEEAVASGCGA